MEIHTYEKVWLVAALVLIVAFIATVTYGAVGLGIAMVGDQGGTIDPGDVYEDERFGDPRTEQVGEDEYEVYVRAQRFTFAPDPIVVPANNTVTFYVTSADVIHSFSLEGTNINTMVIPGEISKMTTEFEETGEYGVLCNEYCGEGHHMMETKVEVVSEAEFQSRGEDE